jgi:hypothetical protein
MPRDVQEALRSGRGRLSVPQWEHLVFGVTAWLLCGVAKLCRLASVVEGGHRTSPARFLSGAEWAAEDVLRAVVLDQLRWMKPQPGEVLYLLIDDTKTAKRGKKMAALTKIWDHAQQRFVHGHILVHAAIVFRGVTWPWSFEMWLPEKYCRDQKLAYRKLTRIAAEMIRAFEPPRGVQVRVLFDAFYLCALVTKACENRDFTWFSVASKNRRFAREGRGKSGKLGDLRTALGDRGVVQGTQRLVRTGELPDAGTARHRASPASVGPSPSHADPPQPDRRRRKSEATAQGRAPAQVPNPPRHPPRRHPSPPNRTHHRKDQTSQTPTTTPSTPARRLKTAQFE